jgi:hypothetical protein
MILMTERAAGLPKVLLSLGLLLVYASLVAYRPLVWRGSWSFDPYDVFHWAGIIGAALFVVSTVIGVDALRARLSTGWTMVHCLLGVLAFILAAVHARTKAAVFLPVHYSSLYMLALLGLLAVSGAGLRFVNDQRYARWWELFHDPVSAALKIALLHHILVKLAVI